MSNELYDRVEQQLVTLLESIQQLENLSLSSSDETVAPLIKLISQQFNSVQQTFQNLTGPNYPYEFYETASEVVEQISRLRLSDIRPLLLKTDIFPLLDSIITFISERVYEHPNLADNKPEPLSDEPPKTVEIARERVNQAMVYASAATVASEAASTASTKLMERLEQQQTTGQANPQLIEEIQQFSYIMFAKNTAAVLAADQAAKAIAAFEDLMAQLPTQRH